MLRIVKIPRKRPPPFTSEEVNCKVVDVFAAMGQGDPEDYGDSACECFPTGGAAQPDGRDSAEGGLSSSENKGPQFVKI